MILDELAGQAQDKQMDGVLDVLMQSRGEVDKLHEQEVRLLKERIAELQQQLVETGGKLTSYLATGLLCMVLAVFRQRSKRVF